LGGIVLGPIDYIVVGFKGNHFDGSILDELSEAVKAGTIRVIDLLFIVKGEDGSVVGGEIKDQPEELKAMMREIVNEDSMPMLSEEDMEKVAAKMENDTAAGVLVVEHLWAMDAGGFLVDDGRIHPEIVSGVMEEIEIEEREMQKDTQTHGGQKAQESKKV
jgi:Family of unknown function (DUF6325)